ncbi:hypothetical protein ONZ45_g1540 [Pleurotus djamor]|nr:hypothetical protein ONZ45_g1540 [Pleurotus djamor]
MDGAPIPYSPEVLTSEDAIVHLEYNPNDVPPKPDGNWTRFICISDNHSRTFAVPPGDVLLHSGDLTPTGRVEHFKLTMDWISEMPHVFKIIIAGNHDVPLHQPWYESNYQRWHRNAKEPLEDIQEILKGETARSNGVIYLQDEKFEFKVKEGGRTWSVYGSPWSPAFFNWAFNYPAEEAEGLISRIPKTDILLTHGPPYKVFDRVRGGQDVGCPTLAKYLPSLQPRLHVFGHIHEAHGATIVDWDLTPDLSGIETADSDVASDITMHSRGSDEESYEDLMEVDTDRAAGSIQPSPSPEKKSSKGPRTVFANAANWPSGPRMTREGGFRVPFAGPGFQPVIVDLRD